MITNRYLSTEDDGVTFVPAPNWVTSQNARHRVEDMAARGEFAELAAADPNTYREWREPGTAWLGYDDPVFDTNPSDGADPVQVAAVYLTGTVEERAAAQRESIRNQIDQERILANVLEIDLRADNGLVVLMDEANNQAETKLNQLAATANPDLDAFDPTFDPLQIGSIATAASLFVQTERVLATDPTLTMQQVTDLEALRVQYGEVASGNDDGAQVPMPTDNVRLKLGVVAEATGTIQCRRIFDDANGWWNHEFELRVSRELSVDDYWVALYRFDDIYLSTPQLTRVPGANGLSVYRADRFAVNIQQPVLQDLKYALCHQHLSNQMFDLITISADETERIDSIRWGGNAS